MRKQTQIQLSIPKPCHENWDKMKVNEKGRHCDSCNKTVIDFSLYTDRELADFFKTLNGSVCGRLNPYQVNRQITITEQPNRSIFYKLFFGTAIASWVGFVPNAHGQNITSPTVTTNPINKKEDSVMTKNTRDSVIIFGTLVDSKTKEGLAFANVILDNNSIQFAGTTTDIDGKFRFILNRDTAKKISLLAVYEGYMDYRIEGIPITKNQDFKVEMVVRSNRKPEFVGLIIDVGPPIVNPNPDRTTISRKEYQRMPH